MLNRYERRIDVLFLTLVVTVIFAPIPKSISLDIFGATGREFSIYPLGFGMILMAYIWVKLRKRGLVNNINIDSQGFF